MKSEKGATGRIAALSKRIYTRLQAASPVASALGLLLFLLACAGLQAFQTGAAVLLFAPAIAFEAALFGAAASIATAALATLVVWRILAEAPGTAPLAAFCILAAAPICLANFTAAALKRSARALGEAQGATAMREALMAEAEHRFGNNLSVICAALNLQARKSSDPATKRALQEASERVNLIAEVNRMLAGSGTAMRFDAVFVERLVGTCVAAHGAQGRVRFTVSVEPIDTRPDAVLPLALVLAECVNNALEHGFSGEARGSIKIRLEPVDGGSATSRLTVWDDGAGLPPGFDSDRTAGTGLTLIRTFARQLDGAFQLDNDPGTLAIFTFSGAPPRVDPAVSSYG